MVLCWLRSEWLIEVEGQAALDPAEQCLKFRRRGQLRPRSPIPPEHEPRLEPRPHLPQRSWPAHSRSLLALSLLIFPPSQLRRLARNLRGLAPPLPPASLAAPLLHASGAPSRTKRHTPPAPTADAAPRHSELDPPPSPALLSPASSSALPTSALHPAAHSPPGLPLPAGSSLLARFLVLADLSPDTTSSSRATSVDWS